MIESRNGIDGEGSGNRGTERVGRSDEHRFDRWLRRELHRAYDHVLAEAVPEELTRRLDGLAADGRPVTGPGEGGGSG
jgi:hypothetical protein